MSFSPESLSPDLSQDSSVSIVEKSPYQEILNRLATKEEDLKTPEDIKAFVEKALKHSIQTGVTTMEAHKMHIDYILKVLNSKDHTIIKKAYDEKAQQWTKEFADHQTEIAKATLELLSSAELIRRGDKILDKY